MLECALDTADQVRKRPFRMDRNEFAQVNRVFVSSAFTSIFPFIRCLRFNLGFAHRQKLVWHSALDLAHTAIGEQFGSSDEAAVI